jgi:hypothetical protein
VDRVHEIARLDRILVDEMPVLIEHTAATQTILARALAGSPPR